MSYKLLPSPNYNSRADDTALDMIILHYTGMKSAQDALGRLCSAESEVSCHYFIDEKGEIHQLVNEESRAWHAGVSFWRGRTDINSYSLGIELVNPGHEWGYRDFPDAQIASLIALCQDILTRHSVPKHHILAHSDIAPDRKQDPGEKFPWKRLAENDVGLWCEPHPIGGGRFFHRGEQGQPIEALQAMFAYFGYPLTVNGTFDEQTECVVKAFQRHYRPERVDGIADESTIITLRNLLMLVS